MFRAMRRMFDYSGRSTRWEYWPFLIGFMIVLIIAGAWAQEYQRSHLGLMPPISDSDAGMIAIAFLGLVAAPHLALKVRRYHDFGWSGWAALWVVVPIANIFFEFMLLFRCPNEEPVEYQVEREPGRINIYNTPAADPIEAVRANDIDQIARLSDMHAQGILTPDEFAAAKARVLRH